MKKNKKQNFINNKTIFITGGTGSFGTGFIDYLLENFNPKKIIIFSRDEYKQHLLKKKYDTHKKKRVLRFFIGDVRDKERLVFATKQVDVLFHAAALKQVDTAEYNPSEFIKTNILGAENIIFSALQNKVKKIIALSTDKASSPINLYGATKLVSDKLFVSANDFRGLSNSEFSVLRYGNVMASRGSIIPYLLELKKLNKSPEITDKRMTRFSLTLLDGYRFVLKTLNSMVGGEIFVPRVSSYRLLDVFKSMDFKKKIIFTGIRPGEKMHEELISPFESENTFMFNNFYVIRPNSKTSLWSEKKFKKKNNLNNLVYCPPGFSYRSDTNSSFLSINQIKNFINQIDKS